MGEPFIGEIRLYSFNYAPRSWAFCNGQLMPINQNQALFSLLGTMYGGDGRVNFALPDLRGRTPVHVGAGFIQGQNGGEENHTLTMSEMPQHLHIARANNTNGILGVAGITPDSTKAVAQAVVSLQGGGTTAASIYATGAPTKTMHPATIGNTGGSQAHNNMMPFLTMNYCIALQGIFPSRN
ncbi:MAG TPA: tail fiber protein [Allosphingosinicella sp.]|jgi:microcystin-dependent protein